MVSAMPINYKRSPNIQVISTVTGKQKLFLLEYLQMGHPRTVTIRFPLSQTQEKIWPLKECYFVDKEDRENGEGSQEGPGLCFK